MIHFKRLTTNATLPVYGSSEAAGADLTTIESVTIPAGKRALLRTGLQVAFMQSGYVALIWPRSKLAAKFGIDVLAGVVDSSYRGEIMISLLNTSEDDVELRVGDKVAQLLIQPIIQPEMVEVYDIQETDRGSKGINCEELRLR